MAITEWIANPLHTGADELGEGIIWSVRGGCLYWVDIPGCAVKRYVPGREGVTTWRAPDMPTALGECRDGHLLVVGRKAAWLLDPASGQFTHFCQIEADQPHNRSNDGKVGPDGQFWFGTMADNFHPDTAETSRRQKTGSLYSLAGNAVLTHRWQGLGVPNGIAFDPGLNRMYVGDSREKTIYHVPMPGGEPIKALVPFFAADALATNDGSTLDRDGTTWNARWGAGCVAAISHGAELQGLVHVANARPTCCVFGGDEMKTLYITTAAPRQPGEEGGLFCVDLPVAGNMPWLFGLDDTADNLKMNESAIHG